MLARQQEVIEVECLPFDVDGDHAFKVPCVRDHMMKATKDGRPWKQWVTSNRGKCLFECYLVPRDNHCIFSSLKYGLPSNKCRPRISAALQGEKFNKHPDTYSWK